MRDRVGPYRVLATATVDRHTITYRAQRDAREETVLIKTAKPGLTIIAPVARALEREGERLRQLRHPLWPTLIETIVEDGVPALVLVDLDGHRLEALLERSPTLEPSSAAAIAIEIARATAALHRAGFAHGSLQVRLVELTRQGGVCLHGELEAPDLPSELASPEHMAPEQIVGDPPDAKSDVFLLGVLLYRMLTGTAPFEGDEDGISQRVRHHPPTPVRTVKPDVPSAVAEVTMRCLAKRRHDRFPDMTSVAARLTRALRHETSLPLELLVTRALARAGLADALAPPLDRGAEQGAASPRTLLMRFGIAASIGVGALALSLLIWQNLRDAAPSDLSGPRGIVDQPAHVRVLARPWAEVFIDGKLVDTTPIGFPLDVSPGRHTVVLRHPSAPDEARSIEVIAGQTILLEVDMQVKLPRPKDAGTSAPSGDRDTP